MTSSDRLVDTEPGLISREIFVNDAIQAEELEKLFTRAWLFVGQEPGRLFRVADGRRDDIPEVLTG